MRILLDGGAYASSSTAVAANAAAFACGPYDVPNARLEATAVYTNNPPCGAMRGFGAVQTCFAGEAQMDKLAAELEIDPIELRLLNALEPGRRAPDRPANRVPAPDRRGDSSGSRPRPAGPRAASARPDPAAGRRREHDSRRRSPARRRVRSRLQEHLLLRGLRRLLRRPGALARRRVRRGALRGGRGRTGRLERDPADRQNRARDRRRAPRSRFDGDRRLGRLHLGLPPDVHGLRRGARRVPGRARRAGGPRRRRGRRRARLPPSRDDAARPGDRPGHRRPCARLARRRRDARRRGGGRRARPDPRRLDRRRPRRSGGRSTARRSRARSKAGSPRGSVSR